ncbi:N-acetylmuramoyl-L-alanine amidase [Dactylosporangium aurantiacum]|uniref:N-acetylmuramoyl-L-alanine amidase n=1 Tax=Dactylosporangium aurantiacum TaxID=35754 RepID=A0A9Q9MF99_9ACTN|nr:N-acetylmuramoyl-L-alanine amidase [Dactylosporangium aurantiacum]MDG6101838.1 N-acetylmuramoyl-L-alanine amidase [Dactylosporangium aurantiacum]UWZ52360.1 N-acetylmuramoyl-L-alanine amidase [Dactylosporangium aurantiacum]
MRRSRRSLATTAPLSAATALALAAATITALGAAPAAAAEPDARQAAYAAAAQTWGVPQSVLLGVSYLESRWDTNGGAPSTDAGYGPMHLTDAATLAAAAAPRDTGGGDADGEDARGDDARAPRTVRPATAAPAGPALQTLQRAAELTGTAADVLRTDPAANIHGGAALLAAYQRAAGGPAGAGSDPAAWYGAVARYSGADTTGAAAAFADEVYATLRDGAARTTDDGHPLTLPAQPGLRPVTSWLDRLGLRPTAPRPDGLECPADLSCEWIPAPYEQTGPGAGDYGNHDLSERPQRQRIEYIVIHDTEASYATTLDLVQDPTYVSWHYTLRSADGHVAQHVRTKDVAWHAGNWYVNAKSVGLEHEGYAAQQGAWYTEAMYRASAKLVRYLALRLAIPLDRQHVLGHDNVPGTVPSTVRGMHWDPGPYWDWDHYFDLLHAPFVTLGTPRTGLVTIDPGYDGNRLPFTGCTGTPDTPCPPHGASTVLLRTAPSADAPLLTDPGLHPGGEPATMQIADHGARAAAGQTYAVAGRQGDWTAIWYLGQRGWFHNPPGQPAAKWSTGLVVTPKPGRASVPVYGRAYPEAAAYPPGVPVQAVTPLQYTFAAGQRYTLGGIVPGEYYRATTFAGTGPGDWTVIRGQTRYAQVQFGHRVMFVNLDDVQILPSFLPTPPEGS